MSASGTKRKREESPERLSFTISSAATKPGTNGPVLVSFPGIDAPASTPFKCYAQKKAKSKTKEKEKTDANSSTNATIIVGETPSVEFVSNEEENRHIADSGCRYLLAVHNPRTSSLTLLPTPAPLHSLARTVKALKSVPASSIPTQLAYREARNALGESFGTKKSQAAIRARERNKVDISAMNGVMGYVQDAIDVGAVGLPTLQEAKEVADMNRPIPPYNATTSDPAEVYDLHDIISENEWKVIPTEILNKSTSEHEKAALLPARNSDWVYSNLKRLNLSEKGTKKKLKIIYYISAMLAFRRTAGHKEVEKAKLEERLSAIPAVILDSLLARFTEFSRESTVHRVTKTTETKLLTHLFALCLKVDDYASDPGAIAHDLSIPPTQVNQLFRSLGCQLKKLSERDRARYGLSDDISNTKMAVLTAPVQFPKPPRRKGRS
ncbi:RNA polymerase I associated factor, A49-like protein [Armillaria mellea]|nr:RNA polymerase I associated factor, A49-like protein [Armillaria mellea]